MKKLLSLLALLLCLPVSAQLDLSDLAFVATLAPASGEAGYSAPAVVFDGVDDYLTRGADFTGNADSKVGTISFWFRLDGGDGANLRLLVNDTLRLRVWRTSGNTLSVNCYNAAAGIILNMSSVNSYLASASWVHVLISYNLATTTGQIYINDASDVSVTSVLDDTIDYTGANWAVGALTDGNQKFNGALADIYFNPTVYIDPSVESNRRKFISATGKPVDLGANGELPTGTAPILFLSGDSTTFHTNLGTGGGMTVTGALTDSGDSPSD